MGRGKGGITKDLYESHGRDFQKKCYTWLNFLYPELCDAKDLGEIDREGVDLYILDYERINYEKAFQCKGFEKVFGESQFKQCSESIKTFYKSGKWANEYFLVLNVKIDNEYSNKIILELNKLVDDKKVGSALLLNSNGFVSYYDSELRKLILQKILESNKNFYDSYTSIMEQKFYYENVPFVENDVQSKSPLEFISNKLNQPIVEIDSKLKGKYFFLVSEFGFGKTTTLLEIYHRCINENFIPIYIPITILDSNAFAGTSSITREIFKLIFGDIDLIENDKVVRFSSESMTTLLQNDSSIVLMFDGLDEHLQFYKFEGLKRLFNSTATFKSPCIFSFRLSYWEERYEDFKLALAKSKAIQDYVFLVEWKDEDISKYIELFTNKNKGNLTSEELFRLKNLQKLILSSDYDQFYGDIPKRPLFLEMILRDVISGDIKQRNISELYLNYFLNKFDRDILGQFEQFTPQRDIPNFSLDYLKRVLIEIHESAAKSCIKNTMSDNCDEAIIENNIHEKDIRNRMDHFRFSNDLGNFISISMLTPISKRGNMNMKLKFVHKSFMEFFIARILCKELLSDTSDLIGYIPIYARLNYPKTVLNFLGCCVDTEIKTIGLVRVQQIINKKFNPYLNNQKDTFSFLKTRYSL